MLVLLEKSKSMVAKDIIISDFFNLKEKKMVDMEYGNDGWLHEIILVKIRDRDLKYYPKCIDGKLILPRMLR